MHDQMTQSEQIKWIFAETGRQLLSPITAIKARILRNREIRNLLENLSDDSLLDRMWMGEPAQPFTMRSAAQGIAAFGHELRRKHIPVIANDEPVSIPVRFKIRRLSIDGILAR